MRKTADFDATNADLTTISLLEGPTHKLLFLQQ
jgi:hypothetical protein